MLIHVYQQTTRVHDFHKRTKFSQMHKSAKHNKGEHLYEGPLDSGSQRDPRQLLVYVHQHLTTLAGTLVNHSITKWST